MHHTGVSFIFSVKVVEHVFSKENFDIAIWCIMSKFKFPRCKKYKKLKQHEVKIPQMSNFTKDKIKLVDYNINSRDYLDPVTRRQLARSYEP